MINHLYKVISVDLIKMGGLQRGQTNQLKCALTWHLVCRIEDIRLSPSFGSVIGQKFIRRIGMLSMCAKTSSSCSNCKHLHFNLLFDEIFVENKNTPTCFSLTVKFEDIVLLNNSQCVFINKEVDLIGTKRYVVFMVLRPALNEDNGAQWGEWACSSPRGLFIDERNKMTATRRKNKGYLHEM